MCSSPVFSTFNFIIIGGILRVKISFSGDVMHLFGPKMRWLSARVGFGLLNYGKNYNHSYLE